MQERYTKQAENVLALAKEAASSCGHSYIGTEHLLVDRLTISRLYHLQVPR